MNRKLIIAKNTVADNVYKTYLLQDFREVCVYL
jgi:hypothetical protein